MSIKELNKLDRDFVDMLMGDTIIYDQDGQRISIEELPDDCEIVGEKSISFKELDNSINKAKEGLNIE